MAVGVGTRSDSGEMDLDPMEEGMLQLHDTAVGGGGSPARGERTARLTDAMQGLMKESVRTWMCFGCSARAFQREQQKRPNCGMQ